MMPAISRGSKLAGLLYYLAGEGRHNEHENQHVIAGSGLVEREFMGRSLTHEEVGKLGKWVDKPAKFAKYHPKAGHVWHCSLSLKPEETDLRGPLSDEQWNQIIHRFVSEMGFDDGATLDGSQCRWVAFRHGVNQSGGDHIHITVNLIRDDFRTANTRLDFPRSQKAARGLEKQFGLWELESAKNGYSTRGWNSSEQRQVQERAVWNAKRVYTETHGDEAWNTLDPKLRHRLVMDQVRVLVPRERLAATIRQCSTEARSEAEFVALVRGHGVRIAPYYAKGGTDQITGYKVAMPGVTGPVTGKNGTVKDGLLWFSGLRLGNDLTLPRLRELWGDTPDRQAAAVTVWNGDRSTPASVRDEQANDTVTQLVGKLIDCADGNLTPAEATTITRQAAALMYRWSALTEAEPGELAQAARTISKSAQTFTPDERRTPQAMRGAMMFPAMMALGDNPRLEQARAVTLMRITMNTLSYVARMNHARGELQRAQELHDTIHTHLENVRHRLETTAGMRPGSDEEVVALVMRDIRQQRATPPAPPPQPVVTEPVIPDAVKALRDAGMAPITSINPASTPPTIQRRPDPAPTQKPRRGLQ